MANETISGKQVVLAALVDNTKVPVNLGVLVRKDDVDFVAFKRGLVPIVLDADRELAAGQNGLPRSSRGTSCA
jgi:hypothetical protein